ncbi:flagellar export chaperone FliS [Aliikangiella coralliicola]|uniref:Flagellar secretion chaperone FliS n=1 Tax=Aliikangiella coralliicola TaxID=2592383 RepID=A0A545U5V6_9GAMM|nr:flagellar export chaperone FliS [Aliikangiella coralliicola]TQV84852.1 flagellar export chaperone FliS [Aliikangiella coralliicola]
MGLTGANAYTKMSAATGVENADPHRLIQMLIDGAIEKINRAKFFMNNKKLAEKGQHISWAISIIGGLRGSLNMEQGGDLAHNLDALYDYCCTALVAANLENSEEKLNDVLGVMQQVKEGWDGIREQALQEMQS